MERERWAARERKRGNDVDIGMDFDYI